MTLVSRWLFIALVITAAFGTQSVRAQSGSAIADAVPTEVPQILTGGFWKKESQVGTYRAVVVSSGLAISSTVDLYIQWLEIKEGAKKPRLIGSTRVKEVTDAKLPNAFIFMQGDAENEMTFMVSSYNPEKDEETQIWLKASGPGKYKIVPPQPLEPPAPPARN